MFVLKVKHVLFVAKPGCFLVAFLFQRPLSQLRPGSWAFLPAGACLNLISLLAIEALSSSCRNVNFSLEFANNN